MKIVVYQDRNLSDKKINNGLNTIFVSLKNKYKDYDVLFIKYNNFKLIKADYAVVWNVFCKFKPDTYYREQIKNYQIKNNNKLIILELGFINRDKYFSIGFNHISNFGNYPEYPNNTVRLKKLNICPKELKYEKKNQSNKDKYILFCTQVPWDTQVQDIDYTNWVITSITKIRQYTDREILVRLHPKHYPRKNFIYFDTDFFVKNDISVKISKNTLSKDFENCYCCIAYNSTVLVDAVLKGIPILSGSKSSIVSDLCVNDFSKIENLPRFTINQVSKCLANISYKQWSLQEMTEGNLFDYYIKKEF